MVPWSHGPRKATTERSTGDAAGSTSHAANIIEALEVGARTLLVDEVRR
jgi:predicted ABC-class ATPase